MFQNKRYKSGKIDMTNRFGQLFLKILRFLHPTHRECFRWASFLGCDFFREETDTQIHKRTGGNNFFKMASFAYMWITPRFYCHAGRRCADTHFQAMPTSHHSRLPLLLMALLRRYNCFQEKNKNHGWPDPQHVGVLCLPVQEQPRCPSLHHVRHATDQG